MINYNNCKYIIFEKIINKVGFILLTFFILQNKQILHKLIFKNNCFNKTNLNIKDFNY